MRPAAGRERILEAGLRLYRSRGIAAVTLGEVAAAARVSRQAVYLHFHSRAGLIAALAAQQDMASPRALALRQAAGFRPAAQALAGYAVGWMRLMPEVHGLDEALAAAAIADPAEAPLWAARQAPRRAALGRILERLAGEGRLAAGWTVEAATAWCLAQLSPFTWRTLVIEGGLGPEIATERLMAAMQATLLA